MKNIIIAGPSRAGKSTLARKINEKSGHYVISLDKLAAAFHGAYPQLGIRLNGDGEKTADNLAPFIGHYLGVTARDHCPVSDSYGVTKGNRLVLEGGYFNFDRIAPVLEQYGIAELRDAFLLIGLVQNQKTADEFFSDFRRYDTEDDWTYHLHDDDLRAVSEAAVPYSRAMTAHLTRYGFTIYDTSRERERVLAHIMEDMQPDLA